MPRLSLYNATLAAGTFLAHLTVWCATRRSATMTSLQKLRHRPILGEKPCPSSDYVLMTVNDTLLANRPDAGTLSLVSSWSSRTARLYRVRLDAPGPTEVVVKVLKDGSEVNALVPALNELADTLSTECPDDFLPLPALGFDSTISGVVMPFVNGASLEQILKRQNVGRKLSRKDISAFVTRAGRLLGRYHCRHAELSARTANDAWDDLEVRVKAVFGPAVEARNMVNPSMVSRSLGDFHPGHLLAALDGRLCLIDPPSAARYCFVGKDIARFLDRMIMIVLSPRAVLHQPGQALSYGELSTAFIRGYNEGRQVPLTRDDRTAIEIYLAFLIKKRLRWITNRRWGALLYYGAPLVYRYRRAMKRLHAMLACRPTLS